MYVKINCCVYITMPKWNLHSNISCSILGQHPFLADICIILLFFCLRFEVLELGFLRFTFTESLTACFCQIYLTFLDPQRLYWTNSDSWRTAMENILSRFWPCPIAAKHLPNFKQRNSELSSPISRTIGHAIHISSLWFVFPAAP